MVESQTKINALLSDNDAIIFFTRIRALKNPDESTCCNCNFKGLRSEKDKSRLDNYRFICLSCGGKQSIRKGTIFEHTRLSMSILHCIIYYGFMLENSMESITKRYNLQYNTVSKYYKQLKNQCVSYINELYLSMSIGTSLNYEEITYYDKEVIESDTMIGYNEEDDKFIHQSPAVEVDEHLLGHYNDGNDIYAKQTWILGIIDRSTKEFKIFLLEDRTAETIIPIIREHVNPGNNHCRTRVYTDLWNGYNSLSQYGYSHHRVNHSLGFGVGTCTTNRIENLWSRLTGTSIFSEGFNTIDKNNVDRQLRYAEYKLVNENYEGILNLMCLYGEKLVDN